MKTKSFLTVMLVSVFIFSCQPQTEDKQANTPPEVMTVSKNDFSPQAQEIVDLELQFKKALRSADAETLDNMLTDDYREITWAGTVQDKKWLLEGVERMFGDLEDDAKPTLIEPEIFFHGEAATLIYLMKVDEEVLGKKETFYTRVLTNFIKEEGDWKKSVINYSDFIPVWVKEDLLDNDLKVLETHDCDTESVNRYEGLASREMVRIKNNASAPISIYALDAEGQRNDKPIQTITPGEQHDHKTFVFSPFVITDVSGNCLGVYQPKPEPGLITIS